VNALNIKTLDLTIEDLTQKNIATKTGTTYTINMKDLNIQKLLGRGEVNNKINITVDKASKRAIEKIESAGGKVTLLSVAE